MLGHVVLCISVSQLVRKIGIAVIAGIAAFADIAVFAGIEVFDGIAVFTRLQYLNVACPQQHFT